MNTATDRLRTKMQIHGIDSLIFIFMLSNVKRHPERGGASDRVNALVGGFLSNSVNSNFKKFVLIQIVYDLPIV